MEYYASRYIYKHIFTRNVGLRKCTVIIIVSLITATAYAYVVPFFAIRILVKKEKKKKKMVPRWRQNERANERVEEFSLKIERERGKESELER